MTLHNSLLLPNTGSLITSETIALVDMDGVICEWQDQFDDFMRKYCPHIPIIPKEDIKIFKTQSLYAQEYHAEIADMMNREGFYRNLKPVAGAIDALHEMEKEMKVFICTAPFVTNETCASEKLLWVGEHLGSPWLNRTIITSDKTMVHGDFLIDDKPLIKGAGPRTWSHIVFDAPYNRHIETRINEWAEWRTVVEKVLQERKASTNS